MASCICSHEQLDHTDGLGRCHEPSGQCCCEGYSELCGKCSHGRYAHDGADGRCTRKVIKTGMPCDCRAYPTQES